MAAMGIQKKFFIDQLASQLRETARIARAAEEDAREAAATLATESEKREDSRSALEYGSLATGQAARHKKTQDELEALTRFGEQPMTTFKRDTPLSMGALVDVATEGENGREERSFLLLPVGAGTELSGPDGDGFLSVITPQSPVGKALMGKRVGDSVEVNIRGQWREWNIVDVG